MIVLDTNVISEGLRPRPSEAVRRWLDAQAPIDLYLCAPVLAELRYGVERLSSGKVRNALEHSIGSVERDLFPSPFLVFDRESANEYGRIFAHRRRIGRPIGQMDALIAAIALANRMAVATRDVDDFSDLGLDVINPFDYGPPAPSAAP